MNLRVGNFRIFMRAGNWFALKSEANGAYSLVSCTVSSGFEFENFDMADRTVLSSEYPPKKIIEELTR